MGIVGVHEAGPELESDIDRIRVASAAWRRFGPVEWAGIVASALAGLRLTKSSASRLATQRGFGSVGALKAGLTLAGAAATAYSAYLGSRISALAEQTREKGQITAVKDATEPTAATPPDLASLQRRQRYFQWVVPLLAGANIACGSYLVQSYRPGATVREVMGRLLAKRRAST